MSVKRRLCTIFCCIGLEFGALVGIPMRPEQIQELMQTLNVPKVAQTTPDESESGDPPDPGGAC